MTGRRIELALDRLPETAWKALGAAFFAGVITWRAVFRFDPRPIWWVETSVYALIVVGYLRRTPPRERAARWYEVLLPLLGGPAPFLFFLTPWNPIVSDPVLVGLFLAGGVLTAVSYAFLGGSFSILVEARELKTGGPYRLVRHPVYLGQILTTTGSVLARFVWWNALIFAAFVAIQIARAFLEERKLLAATPGYAEYRARTWMLVPLIL